MILWLQLRPLQNRVECTTIVSLKPDIKEEEMCKKQTWLRAEDRRLP